MNEIKSHTNANNLRNNRTPVKFKEFPKKDPIKYKNFSSFDAVIAKKELDTPKISNSNKKVRKRFLIPR